MADALLRRSSPGERPNGWNRRVWGASVTHWNSPAL